MLNSARSVGFIEKVSSEKQLGGEGVEYNKKGAYGKIEGHCGWSRMIKGRKRRR